jgi:peptide methionine sulfoxide reductase msrA/msrB
MLKRTCLSVLFLFVLQSPVFAEVTPEPRVETAILAGGCFWCIEADYEKLDGVLDVVSGYTGGQLKDPTYKQVSAGNSGHIEAVEVSFDANTISYAEILDYFWRHIDPTRNDGQFCDRGPQYRPAVSPGDFL